MSVESGVLFFFQEEDGIGDKLVTGVQTCALPISPGATLMGRAPSGARGRSVTETPFVGGAWPSGKARDFGSRIRRFESSRPSHFSRGRRFCPRLLLITPPDFPAGRTSRPCRGRALPASGRARVTRVPAPPAANVPSDISDFHRRSGLDPCRIFSGSASQRLTKAICDRLKVPVGDVVVSRFEDGEVSVRFSENIRGGDVFIVQSTNAPADHLMELLVMLDAAKRASARRVTAVLPYFGYARQDRKDQPRAPITAKLVANLITA